MGESVFTANDIKMILLIKVEILEIVDVEKVEIDVFLLKKSISNCNILDIMV